MTTAEAYLDNPVWYALTNQQSSIALGDARARRYPQDIAPFGAVATNNENAFRSLEAVIAPGEIVALIGNHPETGNEWKLLRQFDVFQMVYEGLAIDSVTIKHPITPLTHANVPALLELIELTHPGPFLPRTIELGRYLSIQQEGQIVAMAGERMHLPGYREISAVCTHPEFQGRGYARQLILQLIHNIQSEGDIPFLHVATENTGAQALYRALSFKKRTELSLFAVKRQSAA